MAVCSNCGTELEDGAKVCPFCGVDVTAQSAKKTTSGSQTDFSAKFEELNNTEDITEEFDADDISKNKGMAILSYLGILVLIPIFGAPTSRFARYHANQGLVLFIADVAYGIIRSVLVSIFYVISWRLGSIISTILGLGWIFFLTLIIIGIINAANGRAKALPIIGSIKLLK